MTFEELPCYHSEVIIEEGLKVCTACGSVLGEQDLTADYCFNPPQSIRHLDTSIHLAYQERCRLRFKIDLQALCTSFNVRNLADTVLDLMDIVVLKRMCTFGSRKIRTFAVASLFILIVSNKPITLVELCHPWGVYAWKVAACIPALRANVLSAEYSSLTISDPLIFIERHWQMLRGSFPEVKDGMLVMRIASGVAEAAKDAWITTGRHAEPISAACILITISSITSSIEPLSMPSLHAIFDEDWPFSAHTLYTRIGEVMRVLHGAAIGLLPWAKTMSEEKAKRTQIRRLATSKSQYGMPLWKSVISQIPDLLRIRQMLNTDDTVGIIPAHDPPAFSRGVEARQRRLLLIQQAEEHLQSFPHGLPSSTVLTRELLDIERLLLDGMSPGAILALTDAQIRLEASKPHCIDDDD